MLEIVVSNHTDGETDSLAVSGL